MGFYDHEIKRLTESCPRLVIKAINSIFSKRHREDSEVIFLNREQTVPEEDNASFMDMLIQIEDTKYHWEFQLFEDNMAIRMYEYAVKETIKQVENTSTRELADDYEIEIVMPEQAVIFLAGANKRNYIKVMMHLPDKQIVSYQLKCISASQTVDELISNELYLLIPFQQVQFNSRMNHLVNESVEKQIDMAKTLYKFHQEVKYKLEKLTEDGIVKIEELELLVSTFANLERYLAEKNVTVRRELTDMGDNDYVAWSDRIKAEGIEIGEARGKIEGKIEAFFSMGLGVSEIATKMNMSIEEVEGIVERISA